MSDCLHAPAPAADNPPTETRAGRLAKFKREQLIVDYLNRGVSVAEIAAHIGVGEKRMRAVIREILARRMPHPPMEFVAIQVSRLNEALLNAFSAMSPTNLKAVAQVVKIVRELDRYGGAFAAEWARPETAPLDAPDDEDAAFASAWLGGAEPGAASDNRPGIPLQAFEKAQSAPGLPTLVAALAERGDAVGDRVYKPVGGERPENLAQGPENIDSAPGIGPAEEAGAEAGPAPAMRPDPGLSLSKDAPPTANVVAPADEDRPENPAQALEKVELAPGIGMAPNAVVRPAPRTAPHQISGDGRPSAPARDNRPENPPQRLENMDSAPGNGWLPAAAFGAFVSRAFPNPPCPGFLRVRTTAAGMAA